MAKFTPNSILASYDSVSKLNDNFQKISDLLENSLSRDGTAPNSMEATLDMNHFNVANVGAPSNGNDAVRLIDLQTALPGLEAGSLALLASDAGGAMVGFPGGGTVTSAIQSFNESTFVPGNQIQVAGSKALIDWIRNDDPNFPMENEGGIWPGAMKISHGINTTFNSGDVDAGWPGFGLFVQANNNGSDGEICAYGGAAIAQTDGQTVFGGDLIAQGSGKDGCKFVGLELDIEPTLDDTNIQTNSIGLAINVFNKAIPGPAIQVGGASGGSFNNGIQLGGLSTTACGLALQSTGQADSLINTTVGTFTTGAILLGSGPLRSIKWVGNGGSSYYDGLNHRITLPMGGGLAIRNALDTASLVSFSDTGSGGSVDLHQLTVDGTKVVGQRQTGTAADATDLASAIALVNDLKAKLIAHGLIA